MGTTDLPPDSQIVPAEHAVVRTASATPFDTCRAFHVNDTGSITVTFASGASITMSVVAGMCYPYKIKAYTTGTVGLITVY